LKLPNHQTAVLPAAKVEDYLLSHTHPDGRGKARFLESFGFSVDDWQTLAEALQRHAASHELAKIEPTPFGTRYVIEGTLETPNERFPLVRTVWFIDRESDSPRFVTAYPLTVEGSEEDDSGT
jgi:hypothetical protein